MSFGSPHVRCATPPWGARVVNLAASRKSPTYPTHPTHPTHHTPDFNSPLLFRYFAQELTDIMFSSNTSTPVPIGLIETVWPAGSGTVACRRLGGGAFCGRAVVSFATRARFETCAGPNTAIKIRGRLRYARRGERDRSSNLGAAHHQQRTALDLNRPWAGRRSRRG